MKILISLLVLFVSLNLFACPNLQGKYSNCLSGNKKFDGEYVIDQHQESNYEVYNIEYSNDKTGEHRRDQFKTDQVKISRNESFPSLGLTLKIEAKTSCKENVLVSVGEAYLLGLKVGSFTTQIFTKDNLLITKIDGNYVNSEYHENIICELQ